MHSFVRFRGFGLVVVPHAPYVVRRVEHGVEGAVAIEHGDSVVLLAPGGTDSRSHRIADIDVGDYVGDWVLDFGPHTAPWPHGMAVMSSDLEGVPFEWWGARGESVMLQGPFRPVPDAEHLVASGQELVKTGEDGRRRWAELAYDVDGIRWRQRHLLLASGRVITSQAPAEDTTATWAAADALASAVEAPAAD